MPHVAARTASRDRDTGRYQSHRPEQTLLYQIVDEYYPAFAALMAEQGKELPGYVQREFEEFLQCGRLEHGFLRVRCESCHAEHLVAFSCKRPAAEYLRPHHSPPSAVLPDRSHDHHAEQGYGLQPPSPSVQASDAHHPG